MTLDQILLTIIASILGGGIPWAFKVHGRLTHIESTMVSALDLAKRMAALESRVLTMEVRQ